VWVTKKKAKKKKKKEKGAQSETAKPIQVPAESSNQIYKTNKSTQ